MTHPQRSSCAPSQAQCVYGWLQVTFTATVISASDAQLLGPSDGVVQFSLSGSNAFSFVHKTVLGSAKVSRTAVSGLASLTMHKDSAGLTLLPGLPRFPLMVTTHSCLSSARHRQRSCTFPAQ